MIKNYFKIAFRSLIRNRIFSILNISGLAIGMACSVLIYLWIMDEISYDTFHENSPNLYRVVAEQVNPTGVTHTAITQYPLGPSIKNDLPEVIDFARILIDTYDKEVKYEQKTFRGSNFIYADPSFLTMFSFPLVSGNVETALNDPYSVLLTKELAEKYFGEKDPLGEILEIDYFNKLTPFTVTGVLESVPLNSHIQFDFLIPFHIFAPLYKDIDVWNTADNYYTYILLANSANPEMVDKKLENYLIKYISNSQNRLHLQPVKKIHLFSDLKFDAVNNSQISYVWFFLIIGIFVLLIACINYVNLATARSQKRSREIGLRKIAGAQRISIATHLMIESLLFSLLSLLLAIIFVELLRPLFNSLSGKSIDILYLDKSFILLVIGLILFSGLFSGVYPAIFLSSFLPLQSLMKSTVKQSPKFVLRKLLVVFQFSVSVILIISTLTISRQLDFFLNKDLGFEKENLIFIPVKGDMQKNYQAFKKSIIKHPNIFAITGSNILPVRGNESLLDEWEGSNADEQILINITSVDYNYFETLGMKIIMGRGFSEDFPGDKEGVVVNEEAIRQMGLQSPIGKGIYSDRRKIIGVVKDYHYMSLDSDIEPIVLSYTERSIRYLFIRLNSTDIGFNETIQFIASEYGKHEQDYSFEYILLDNYLDNLYQSENRLRKLIQYFSILAILISCLGLFGLSTFTLEQRTKEVGIRKANGATSIHIFNLFIFDFVKWIMVSLFIAFPVSYFIMKAWLQNFAYRANMNFSIFLSAAVIAMAIAIFTVFFQSARASQANPVNSLRYE